MSLINTLIPSRARALAQRENGEPNPAIKPLYELVDNKEGFALTVYLPGVAKDGLELTSESSLLRIVGRRAWSQPEGWSTLYSELPDAPFELNLEHDQAIDIERIHAELRDGVLRVSLPKAEALRPRKIAVN
jgi:HSP20 family molecular chaperone IbpA